MNMTSDVKLSEWEKAEPFYPELLGAEEVQLADASEAERIAVGTDQKKRDNCWHSFTTV